MTKLQGHVAELQVVAEQRLRLLEEWEARSKAAEEETQRFRAAADLRLEMVHSLQGQLQAAHEHGNSLQEELGIAGEQLGDARRAVEQRGQEIAALAAALDQARVHGDEVARSLEQTTAELAAARLPGGRSAPGPADACRQARVLDAPDVREVALPVPNRAVPGGIAWRSP